MEDSKFHHTFPVEIRFTDVDRFGHVNNTEILSFAFTN
ncbi:hypothetical protein EZS27_013828 [termite gut metagenome]|uniref:Acyl-ACP thioesterase-like C-terminal domain-containing protein n=1 Tax=termite gut metagenome TaxID=433724 RepID=A0A5J4RVW5_9ZZZZ